MRTGLIVLWMLLCSITSAAAQVSIGIGLPGVSIGFNLPVYPQLVLVPGYPVYYAPQVNSNYFFYDGVYWLYQGDNWYASSWYNGPWQLVVPEAVPLFVLRIPVRYYRRPPPYFHGWRSDAPPHWGEHWGNAWEQGRSGWDTWNRSSVPPPAPLPVYQRQYSGNRYPAVEQQQVLQGQNYRYQPRDAVVQQHYQAPQVQSAPVPSPPPRAAQRPPQRAPQERASTPQDQHGSNPPSSLQQGAAPAPHGQPPQKGGGNAQRATATKAPPQQSGATAPPQPQGLQPQQRAAQRQQQAPMAQSQDKGPQGKRPTQGPKAQQQPQQPQQGAAQHQQQASRAQGQDKGPQGTGPAQEPKQGEEKGRDKGEQQRGERSK
jgi:hypothetical protein